MHAPLRIALASIALAAALAFAPRDARAEEHGFVWLPGASREVAQTRSASRDVAVAQLVFAPRVRGVAAVDFGIALVRSRGIALRFGMRAAFDLEHAEPGLSGSLPLPGQGKGPMLWRGFYGTTFAISAEELAHRWLGERGALELTLALAHESDHVTGADFDDAPRAGDILDGGGGNFVVHDAVMRAPLGAKTSLALRVQDRIYFRGPILHAPGIDAELRWHAHRAMEPTLSLFAERLFVNHNLNAAKDGYFAAMLAGIALHGRFGEIMPFGSIDVGNGKGLLINHREMRVGIGVRYAPF